MRRVWRVSEFMKFRRNTPFSLNTDKIISKSSAPLQIVCEHVTQTPIINGSQTTFSDVISLFSGNSSYNTSETAFKEDMRERVSMLKDQISLQNDDFEKIEKVLEEYGAPLFRIYSDGSAVVELLTQLKSLPHSAVEVLNWRRRQLNCAAPMTVEEYTKGIVMAGRLKNVDLAIELFKEASNKQLKAFGRVMLVDHMETTLREIKDLNLTPTLQTYKGLIAGYLTAWMWEKMEKTYLMMKASSIKPDIHVHLLMLRGYAHSGQLEKMEEMYEMVRDHVDHKEIPLIRNMICAYCRSSNTARVEKVEELLRLIPEDEYRPWLNVMLICLYAKEDLLDQMEKSINEAFEHKTYVTTSGTIRCITSSYFRHNAVDKLADFVQRAEHAGWKICRSLYHCKMVMYSSQMRLSEMESVLGEMDKINMPFSKKTFWILYKAYKSSDQRSKLEQVVGMMCKHGHEIQFHECNL